MFRDTMDTRYTLREGDTSLAHHGDTVAAGDVIATGSGVSAIVPYAAMLRLSPESAADEVVRHDGTAYEAGDPLGSRRAGLMTRSVSAPANGTALGLPNSGTLVLCNQATYEYRARYGGIVRKVSPRAIVIASDVTRCVYAFADETHHAGPLAIEPALLDTANTEEMLPHVSRAASSTVIAHIGDAAHLKAVVRAFRGTLFVGSVTERVAWALLERSQTPESRRTNGPAIIVLDGVGDVHHGRRAVAPLSRFHDATVILDHFIQTVTFIPSGDLPTDDESPPFSLFGKQVERRDPANYRVPCDTTAPQWSDGSVPARGRSARCRAAIHTEGTPYPYKICSILRRQRGSTY